MALMPELVGESPDILAIKERIARLVARASEVRRLPPVLIQGETGSGKGLVARALHRAGPRSERALRRRQLRGDPGDPARSGDVRLRAGRLHRRPPGEEGPLPDRPPGHAVPGRDRAPARWPPGQAAHGARGAHRAAARRDPERAGGRLDHHRDQPRPPGGDARGPVPRGPLSPARGPDPRAAAAAGAPARHRAPRGALPGAGVRRLRAAGEDAAARTRGRRSWPIAGPATSASS